MTSIATTLQVILSLLASLHGNPGLSVTQQQAIDAAAQQVQAVSIQAAPSPVVSSVVPDSTSTVVTVSLAPSSTLFTMAAGSSTTYPALGYETFTVVPNEAAHWKAAASANWIVVAPNGINRTGGTASVRVNSQIAATFAPGLYNGTITFSYASSGPYFRPVTVGVTLNVSARTQQGPSLSLSLDPSSPASNNLVMGTTGNVLAVYRLTAVSSTENIQVKTVTVFEATTATKPGFANLALWNGPTEIGPGSVGVPTSGGYLYTFQFAPNMLIVPQGNSIAVSLRGDINPWGSQSVQDGQTYSFQIPGASSISAFGATSDLPAIVSGSAYGNPMKVYRSTMTVTAAQLGGTNHFKSSSDALSTITFSANPAGPVALDQLTVTFSGNDVTSSLMNASDISLIDTNGNNVVLVHEATESVNPSQDTATWSFPISSSTGQNGFEIGPGQSYPFTLRINSTVLPPLGPNVVENLSATIRNPQDVSYADGLDVQSLYGITLLPSVTPITLATVTYPPMTMGPDSTNQMASVLATTKAMLLQLLGSLSQ